MRRRVHDDEAPPPELVSFDGAPYFHDAGLWHERLEDWLAAREQWAADRGLDFGEVFPIGEGTIPDCPLNPEDL